jgi:hypothetical protein
MNLSRWSDMSLLLNTALFVPKIRFQMVNIESQKCIDMAATKMRVRSAQCTLSTSIMIASTNSVYVRLAKRAR